MKQHIEYLAKAEKNIILLEIGIAIVGLTGVFFAVLEVKVTSFKSIV